MSSEVVCDLGLDKAEPCHSALQKSRQKYQVEVSLSRRWRTALLWCGHAEMLAKSSDYGVVFVCFDFVMFGICLG